MHADVGVIGVGSMGSLTLWELARRDVSAIGFEQYAPGHDRGAAGGDTRVFRTAYMEGEDYVPLLLAARDGWQELERASGVQLLDLCGELNIGAREAEWLQGIKACAERFELPHEVLDQDEMRRRYPQHRLDPNEIAVLDEGAGVLRSEHAVLAAAKLAESEGASIRRGIRVDAIDADDSGVTVVVDGDSARFEQVVVAAGPWALALLPALAPLIEVRRAPMTWYPTFDPSQYVPERFPVFARADAGIDMFGAPSPDGYTVKAATIVPGDVVSEPDRLDRSARGDELTAMNAAVADYLPGLVPSAVRCSIYMDAYTPDHHGLVGALPGLQRVTVLAGFSGHGFKLAPAIARAAADLVVSGATELPVHHLAASRFA